MRYSSINMLVNSNKAKTPSLDTKGWSSGQLQEFGEAALKGEMSGNAVGFTEHTRLTGINV